MSFVNRTLVNVRMSDIHKIRIITNPRQKSLSTIKREQGCDYIINGSLFNMYTFEQYCNVKANWVPISVPGYSEYGLAWTENIVSMKIIPSESFHDGSHIGCEPLIHNGVGLDTSGTNLGGWRGRTAIGTRMSGTPNAEFSMWCSRDGTSYSRTPSQLRDELLQYGWDSAVMLDGGGSSQSNMLGERVYSSRPVANVICVWLKKQIGVNPYPVPLYTLYYGIFNVAYVKWLQWQLCHKHGFSSITIDGSFGRNTLAAVKKFQEDKGLVVDGYVGPATRSMLLT